MSFFSKELEIMQAPELEMTFQQFGIYCSLKNAYLKTGRPLSLQAILRVIPCRSEQEVKDLQIVLHNHFYLKDERWASPDFDDLLDLIRREKCDLFELSEIKEKYRLLLNGSKHTDKSTSHTNLSNKTTSLN